MPPPRSVVVLGGGYAGLQATRRLASSAPRHWAISLVDRRPHHQLITRLPEIVGGRLPPGAALIPFERVVSARVQLIRGDVGEVDLKHRAVQVGDGWLQADSLVIAMGSAPAFNQIAGAAEHAYPVRSVEDAERLCRGLQQSIAGQDRCRVVVIGGGYTATEVAGELLDWAGELVRAGSGRSLSVSIVSDVPRLLFGGDEDLGRIAARDLARRGASLYFEEHVFEVGAHSVTLASGREIEADTVIWAAGSHSAVPIRSGDAPLAADGRLPVNEFLQSREPQVYAIGDAALIHDFARDRPVSSSAQLAVQEGRAVADNIISADRAGALRRFHPHVLGEALSLGVRDGAARVAGITVTGRAALAAKEAALVRYLVSIGGRRLAAEYAR